jgi:hypothetical protein
MVVVVVVMMIHHLCARLFDQSGRPLIFSHISCATFDQRTFSTKLAYVDAYHLQVLHLTSTRKGMDRTSNKSKERESPQHAQHQQHSNTCNHEDYFLASGSLHFIDSITCSWTRIRRSAGLLRRRRLLWPRR